MKESGRSEPQSAPMRCHGRGGRYTGGEWVPITDIEDSPPRCTSSCSDCPKRRVPDGGVYDVVVVGAGVIGSAVCRELSKYTPSVLLLEAAEDVAAGATKANSGIVHSGYNSLPGTLRAKFCWPGCRSFPQLDRELNFGFERNGSMVVARSEEEDRLIRALLVRGRKNGVEGLRVVERDELRRMEPHVTPAAVSALWSPHAGIVSPYELAIALAENAADNGVEVRLRREVVRIDRSGGLFSVTANRWARPRGGSRPHAALGTAEEVLRAGGSGSRECTGGVVVGEETVRARYVINCAGGGSAEVARLIGDDSFVVRPRVGNFVVLRREQGRLANATLFPCPDPKKGKGILVQHTLWGNLMLGPTSRDIHDPKAAAQTTEEVLAELINSAKDLVPAVDAKQIIHSFSGSRSRSGTGDWVIGPSLRDPRFINVAAIDSPATAGGGCRCAPPALGWPRPPPSRGRLRRFSAALVYRWRRTRRSTLTAGPSRAPSGGRTGWCSRGRAKRRRPESRPTGWWYAGVSW
eukprot:TRINITY_DN1713_c0_g1_i1.p1 TRINITY_DN1713_c0_g1~~TRINITY_DN1713_c0_g1_i1.p1  ORF type:complete len:522 (+),score=125.84 TRINITY_DN1713_c0_g1_i1:96-1661(+)